MKMPTIAPVTGITLCLLPLVYMAVYAVLFTDGYSEQLRTVVVTAVVSGLLGVVGGYWLDSSAKEAKQTDPPPAPSTVTTIVKTDEPKETAS